MNIEIHHPELEALIRQRMASGAFHDVEDALIQALKYAPPPQAMVQLPATRTVADLIPTMQEVRYTDEIESERPASDRHTFLQMLDSVRGLLTDEEVDTLFKRDPSVDRHIDLS